MSDQNKLTKFWEELKRRKVVRVILVYATTAFILLQLVDMLLEPLNLPQWVMTFFVVLLLVGFPIAVIFSWIFDITPQGVEVTKKVENKTENESYCIFSKRYVVFDIIIGVLLVAVVILAYPKIFRSKSDLDLEKTIALLPLIYDSTDSSKISSLNGLWGAVIDNLSMIADFEKVIPRTSVEKYRNKTMSIPDIAKELEVDYIGESNGQVMGNKIQYTVKLINGVENKQLWFKNYTKSLSDIELLQQNIAKEIANEINVYITPEEEQRIEVIYTKNDSARYYYFEGSEYLTKGVQDYYASYNNPEKLKEAIKYFEKAIEFDIEYALPYAELARTYYYLGSRAYNENNDKIYTDKLRDNAINALMYNPLLDKSWVAVGLFYHRINNYSQAIEKLEKALEYNPSSEEAIWTLNYIYAYNIINDVKSLEYSFLALKLKVYMGEFRDEGFWYFSLGRACRNLGFFNEAEKFINMALDKNSNLPTILAEKANGIHDFTNNYYQSKNYLDSLLNIYPNLSVLVRTMALTCYLMSDFEEAYKYFELQKSIGSLNTGDEGRYGLVCSKLGKNKESEEYFGKFEEYATNLNNVHRYRNFAGLYSFRGETEKAIEQLKLISIQDNYPYWIIRVLRDDPLYDNIRHLPDFQTILNEIETKFWANHERIKANLTEKGLLPIKM